jgi:hypothetical protein
VRNDTETMTCEVCGKGFQRYGRRRHCSDACRQPGDDATRRRESRSSPRSTPSTNVRAARPASSASSTARTATASPAGSVPGGHVLAVTSRSRSSRAHAARPVCDTTTSKDPSEEVIRRNNRRRVAAIQSTGLDYFSSSEARHASVREILEQDPRRSLRHPGTRGRRRGQLDYLVRTSVLAS